MPDLLANTKFAANHKYLRNLTFQRYKGRVTFFQAILRNKQNPSDTALQDRMK